MTALYRAFTGTNTTHNERIGCLDKSLLYIAMPSLTKVFFIGSILGMSSVASAQVVQDSVHSQMQTSAFSNDPTKFFSRTELFSELQHLKTGGYLNMTTFRTILRFRKRFTTRLDIPYVYNSTPSGDQKQSGLGDVTFRLLGYRILDTRRSGILASVEISMNTAESALLGTGKNIIIPSVAYSTFLRERRTILALSLQQFNSVSGDEKRADLSFSKLQAILIHMISPRVWTVIMPELYVDYINGGTSMNLEGQIGYRITGAFGTWLKAGAGLYGEHPARYRSTTEIGCRLFLSRPGKA